LGHRAPDCTTLRERGIDLAAAASQFAAMQEPRPGRYRHYKGKEYRVLGLARHSETEEELVVYQLLYGDFSWWVRPRKMFLEHVEVNGVSTPRFAYVAET
jgi:hypothetical protein